MFYYVIICFNLLIKKSIKRFSFISYILILNNLDYWRNNKYYIIIIYFWGGGINTGLNIHNVSSLICCDHVNKHKLFIIILVYYGIACGVRWHAYYTKIALILEYLKSSWGSISYIFREQAPLRGAKFFIFLRRGVKCLNTALIET
jgi:hypothetical protein